MCLSQFLEVESSEASPPQFTTCLLLSPESLETYPGNSGATGPGLSLVIVEKQWGLE